MAGPAKMHPQRLDPRLAEQIARLELLRRLGLGAAHTLNNAYTAILGETLCLADERKRDPLVAESCGVIQSEIERCARLTRSVALRVQRRESALEESDLVALVRGLEPLLRDTVSRSIAIDLALPESRVVVRGAGEDLELLVLLAAHRVTRRSDGGAALAVRFDARDPERPALEIQRAGSAPAEGDRSGDAADGGWDLLVRDALCVLGERHGVDVEARDAALRLVFEAA